MKLNEINLKLKSFALFSYLQFQYPLEKADLVHKIFYVQQHIKHLSDTTQEHIKDYKPPKHLSF